MSRSIDSGARQLKHLYLTMKEYGDMPDVFETVTKESFKYYTEWLTPNEDDKKHRYIVVKSYDTNIAYIDVDTGMLDVLYGYKNATVTSKGIIRSICNVFGIPKEKWEEGEVIIL